MMMRLISPRRTAPYQTLDSSSRTTSPSTVAPGTTHALEWMVGPFCSRGTMPSCPVDSESGLIFIRDEPRTWNVQCRFARLQPAPRHARVALSLEHYNMVIKGLHH